jgi:pullulanase
LWDKLAISAKDATEAERKQMQKLALSIVLTSQGIPFLHAGTEFLRTKKGNDNSYNAGDDINAIDWDLKSKNKDVFEYVQALVKLRKAHPAFRMSTAKQISDDLRFINNTPPGTIAYIIDGAKVGDSWKKILVILNGSSKNQNIQVEMGGWKKTFSSANGFVTTSPGPKQNKEKALSIEAYSCDIYIYD